MEDRFRVRVWDTERKTYIYDAQFEPDYEVVEYDNKYISEQCTGLEDINGNLIYENDIVECVDDTIKFVGTIKYCAYFFGFFVKRKHRKFGLGTVPYTRLKVIGNVRNNPELLEENND